MPLSFRLSPIGLPLVFVFLFSTLGFSQSKKLPRYDVADGLVVELAVEPGLIRHPIMATVDPQGRLYVCESAGVNWKPEELEKNPPHSVKMLVDTDSDGVWDRATTFADRMHFPQGALKVFDSLYVMSPPSLWQLTDADGDGVAEEREELVTGFEYTGNAADVHGPFLHPNGRLYWCHGRKGHRVVDPHSGELVNQGKGARIWSCNLDGSDVQVFAGGGMDNPVEVDFTPEGEIIGTVNLFYGRPRGDTLVHWLHGGAYPRYDQELVLEEFFRTGDLLTEIHDFGHVAVSGMCRYRSGQLVQDWKDNWLVTHFNTGELTRTEAFPDGSGFRAGKTETIFRLHQADVHFTDVLEDRNGDLLVLDTGGWFRIGCPTSQLAKPEIAGAIYRIRPQGERIPPPRVPADWEDIATEQVAAFLDSDTEWVQECARAELAARGEVALAELRVLLQEKKGSERARRNAVWTLARMRFSDSPDLIFEALTDESDSVRQAACNAIAATRSWQIIANHSSDERAIEIERNKTITGTLLQLLRGGSPAVARSAAVALGRMGESRAVGALLGRATRAEGDRSLHHAITFALIEIDDFESTRLGLQSENPSQVVAALFALDQMPTGNLEALTVIGLLESNNPQIREAAISICARHPDWDAALANVFFGWADSLSPERVEKIETVLASFDRTPPIRGFVSFLLEHEDLLHQELGLSLIQSSRKKISLEETEWAAFFRDFLQESNPLQESALQALGQIDTDLFDEQLSALAADENLPSLIRVRALMARQAQNKTLSQEAFSLLLEILKNNDDFLIRSQALGILGKNRLLPAQRSVLAKNADQFNALELPLWLDLYPRIDDEAQAAEIAEKIAQSPGFRNLDPQRLQQLFAPFDQTIRGQIEALIEQSQQEQAERGARVAELAASLSSSGNAERGKVVFDSGKGSCNICHVIGKIGRDIGPDLSTIGRIRSGSDLLESILYPSESLARDFESFSLKKTDDSQMLGLIRSESRNDIEFVDAAGQVHRISRDEVASLTLISTSLMPIGLDQALGNQDLLDLIAYLLSRK